MPIPTIAPVILQTVLRDSGNQPITDGWLEVKADGLLAGIYQSPKPLITTRPRRFTPNPDGLISVELVNSEDSGVTYQFTIGYTVTTTIAPVPPSLVPTVVTNDVITDQFHAYLPRPVVTNTGSIPVQLADLIPTGISLSSLDASIGRVADRIVNDPVLRSRAVQGITIKGAFNPQATYFYGDLVTLATSPIQTWICINRNFALPTSNVSTAPNDWLRLL